MSTAATTETKPAPSAIEKIKVKVDGRELEVPRLTADWSGKLTPTTMIQACELAKTEVPHYCYHPEVAGRRQLPHVPCRIRHARARP